MTRTLYVKDQELWDDAGALAKDMGISLSEFAARGLRMMLEEDRVKRLSKALAKGEDT